MSKVSKSFRLDSYVSRQLEALSYVYGVSQAEIIEFLVSLLDLGVCDLAGSPTTVEYKLKEAFDLRFRSNF